MFIRLWIHQQYACLNSFRKNQRKKSKIFSRKCNSLKDGKLSRTRTILRLNKKNFKDEELPHELFLISHVTIRQATK